MAGTAALMLQTQRSFEQLKAWTPMPTVDEGRVAQMFLDAARAVKDQNLCCGANPFVTPSSAT